MRLRSLSRLLGAAMLAGVLLTVPARASSDLVVAVSENLNGLDPQAARYRPYRLVVSARLHGYRRDRAADLCLHARNARSEPVWPRSAGGCSLAAALAATAF